MSIQIQGPTGRPPAEISDQGKTASEARSRQGGAQGASVASRSTVTDQVSLTAQASQLQALENQISALPVIDTQRVTEVQQALATGSFQVDPARVADKMLSFEVGLTPQAQ